MKKKHFIFCVFTGIFLLLLTNYSFAQRNKTETITNLTEEEIEQLAEDLDENVDINELYEKLETYFNNPINLNNTDAEELRELGLLNDFQINNLLSHIDKHGNLIRLEELQTIEGFSDNVIQRILSFVKISDASVSTLPSFNQILDQGKHQFVMRGERILEDQKGYLNQDDTTASSFYLGNPWKLFTRYRFNYNNKIKWGVTAEKDAGEEFFEGNRTDGFDFYSAHLFVKDISIFKKVAIGDYKLEYGQGLSMWTGLAFGKSSSGTLIKKNANGINAYSSLNEYFFKRGIALSTEFNSFQLDVFASQRYLDANITVIDTLNEEATEFSSFQESGFHRTESELEDRKSIQESLLGAYLKYKRRNFHVGLLGHYTEFGADIELKEQVYSQFDFAGNHFYNLSVDYNYLINNFNFFGEVARSENDAYAQLHGLLLSVDRNLTFSFAYRNYQRDYVTNTANPLRESDFNNEVGTYIGYQLKLNKELTLSGYFDMFSYPWLRFGVDGPSSGTEYINQLNYKPNKKLQIYIRHKNTTKEDNTDKDVAVDYLVKKSQDNFRLHVSYKVSKSVTLRNRIEYAFVNREEASPEQGYLIYQDVIYNPFSSPFSFSARYALFDSDSFDSRLYAFENDILYSYAIPSFSDTGLRSYLNIKYSVNRHIDVWARYERTDFINKEVISSGLEEIDGNIKSKIKLQVRYEF